MANEIAKRLIYDLRHDELTRRHFDIGSWNGSAQCGTVGCIAGTAVAMKYKFNSSKNFDNQVDRLLLQDRNYDPVLKSIFYTNEGQKILGIPFYSTATSLFLPVSHMINLTTESVRPDVHGDLPNQARPDLDTIQKMVDWAEYTFKQVEREGHNMFTPDRAAFALERVVVDEVPYCNWAEAFENA